MQVQGTDTYLLHFNPKIKKKTNFLSSTLTYHNHRFTSNSELNTQIMSNNLNQNHIRSNKFSFSKALGSHLRKMNIRSQSVEMRRQRNQELKREVSQRKQKIDKIYLQLSSRLRTLELDFRRAEQEMGEKLEQIRELH